MTLLPKAVAETPDPPRARMNRRAVVAGLAATVLVPFGLFQILKKPFPPDRTPEGAYMRIARSVTRDDPREFFAYLETEAQWACFTVRDMRKKAQERVQAAYPEPQRGEHLAMYRALAEAPDGGDVFAELYRTRQWGRRLRKDLSGVARVDHEGDRASVVTVRGTRWPFRRRENGIWGLTVFTGELVAEAEKATRDLAVVESAAADYARVTP